MTGYWSFDAQKDLQSPVFTVHVSILHRGPVTRNLEARGSSRIGASGFFRGSVLGQDTSEFQPCTG